MGFVRRCTTVTVAALMISAQFSPSSRASAVGSMRTPSGVGQMVGATSPHAPPQRIAVPEPSPRARMPLPPLASLHAVVSHDIHVAHGVPGHAPPMLRPGEIDGVLTKARQRAAQSRVHSASAAPPATRAVSPGGTRARTAPGNSRGRGTRSVQFTAGTGINPWWRYQEESVPGGGRLMVNLGTGNLLLQDDDMSVPHKGIALAFRRTYNSQSQHDVNGTDGSAPSMYGNGWTSTFDAHLSSSAPNSTTVWDIDGAHYDYTLASDGVTWTPPTGQHATLTWDGGCGYLWTKKSGTSYYFWQASNGPCGPSYGGLYAGKLYQIIGRNRNTYITFGYSWDVGTHTAGDKVSAIYATTESGMTATLAFADVSGYRLLDHITFPDGATTVSYGYDTLGNLTTVSRPPNNAAGTRPVQSFGYYNPGGLMGWVASPRWNGPDGGALFYLGFNGTTAPSATVAAIAHVGVVNPPIADGTGTPLQPSYPTGPVEYLHEWYQTGVTTPTYRDTDGHFTNWVVDGLGRPTQTQACTATSGIWACTGAYLVTNETWDANNNLVAQTDARGYETDYAYDANGNTIASAAPVQTTSEGTFRPAKLLDFDAYNNIVAYCDEHATHLAGGDWVTAPTSSDSRCATLAAGVPHTRATLAYPSYQPYGELSTLSTPLGYTKHFSYAASQQAGNDYGLPTTVSGDSFTQIDGTTVTPTQTYWYDANGIVRCYSNGNAMTVLSVDALGRTTSVADGDDSSANGVSICGKSGGQPGWNTQRTYGYFPDGSLQNEQTPAERAGAVSRSLTHDLDGNLITETKHSGCRPGSSCTAGVTTKWYDGADRLVEVQLPHDNSWDVYASNWLKRYIYDLSQAGTVSLAGTPYRAYGGLYKTQEWVPPSGSTTPAWQDLRGSSYDAVDRDVSKYTFSPRSPTTVRTTTKVWDASSATGLLSSVTDPLGQTTSYTYDTAGRPLAMQFAGDGGVTPNKSFVYDAVGRIASATGAVYGTETTSYDADGRVMEHDEPTNGSMSSPARITYDYYPNGQRKDINVASSALNVPAMMSYAYRADGKRSRLRLAAGWGDFVSSYTDGGRVTSQTDPFTGTAMPSPQAPVNPGTVYPATSWAYDATGQLTTLNLPQTFSFQSIAHDDEGMLSAWNGSSSANGPAGVQFTTSIRGEMVLQAVAGSERGAPHRAKIANGASVPAPVPIILAGQPPSGNGAPTIEPINAVVTAFTKEIFVPNGNPDIPGWVDCGPQVSSQNYDAASRIGSRNVTLTITNTDPACGNAMPDDHTVPSYAYDAEDHTTTIGDADFGTTASLKWSPSGRAYAVTYNGNTYGVHYDGGRILFISDSSGALVRAKIEALANYAPAGGLVVLDRGISGDYMSQHNGTFYGGVSIGSSVYKDIQNQTAVSIPYIFYGSTNDTLCWRGTTNRPAGCAAAGNMEYARLEGFEFSGLTIQGARAVQSASGQWTTPDAFAGAVHDPMSQKSFMWDNNNAYSYSDPTGFRVQSVDTANADGSAWMQTNGGAQSIAVSGGAYGDFDTIEAVVEHVMDEISKSGANVSALSATAVASAVAEALASKDYNVLKTYSTQGGAVAMLVSNQPQHTSYIQVTRYYTIGIAANGQAATLRIVETPYSGHAITREQSELRYMKIGDSEGKLGLLYRRTWWPEGMWMNHKACCW